MYAVVVWDWLISLNLEYRLIWKKQWTPVKCIYLFCRYWPILFVPYTLWVYTTNHPEDTCKKVFQSVPLLMTFNMISAELVLLIRTYAFLGRKTWMLAGLLALLAGVLGYQLYVPIAEMELLPLGPPGTLGPCFPVAKPHSAQVTGFFIAPLLFDGFVTALTVWKAFSMRYRFNKGSRESTPLVTTFVNEGLFTFLLISLANLINGAFYLQPVAVLQALNIPLSIMFPNILASRLILALRNRGNNVDLNSASVTPASGRSSGARSDPHQVTFGSAPSGNKRSHGTNGTSEVTTFVKSGRDEEEGMELEEKAETLLARHDEEATLGYGGGHGVRMSVTSHMRSDQDLAFEHLAVVDERPQTMGTGGQIAVRVDRVMS
ncbi:hypothetical protein EXIGLDRAFT_667485 [Exidia glandulosa HHB12029]|uniref:DUF6533 domain-containing protein n=1 Tax=Exidia glandulosa HHB12029 TaxID=1314781 RepID=A0A166BEU9_EXIGL|nr:hypothetical protein EXIGLDRAFT_667485 [Exidia glandulosa HHB12029]